MLLVPATTATADFSRVNGQIAFVRTGGAGQIWLSDQDGSSQHEIAVGSEPSWSPDGSKIAYVVGDSSGSGELWVMNADGSDRRRIDTDLGPFLSWPSWSPDGTQLVVSAFGDIYAVPLAGGRSRFVASGGDYPRWSPDGGLIAFVRSEQTIMLVEPDGSDLRQLPWTGPGLTSADPRPAWSPDGKRIAYSGRTDGGIEVENVDGTGMAQLLPPGNLGRSYPDWSPDGTRIAFFENGDICTGAVGVGGAGVARLTWTAQGSSAVDPAWQPLPPGSPPAGVPGRSVGPPPGFPRGESWNGSCDKPDDVMAISAAGPAFALVGSTARYTITVRSDGHSPIAPVIVGDQYVSGAAGRVPAPSQGSCYGFSHDPVPPQWTSECDLGGFRPGDSATVHVRLRLTSSGAFTNVAWEAAGGPGHPKQRFARIVTDVVRCSLRGTSRADPLQGTPRPDVVCGFAGNDRIDVRGGGTDTVFCGPGRDTVAADPSDRIAPDCEEVRQ